MIPFWAETLLLMAAFYFLGAVLGCISRRSLAPAAVRGVPAERRVDPLPDVVARHDAQSAQPRHGADPGPAPQAARASVAGGSRAAASRFQRQDLKNIQGIDAVTEARLNGLGIVRFEQIAGWLRADVQRVGEAIGQKRRIAQENWIEQAQILAKDGQTLFSVRRARGEGSTAAPTPDESGPALPASEASLPRAMSRAGVAAVVVAPPASTEASSSVQRVASAVPIRPVDAPAHDDLRRIGGVTAEIETRLNALGISRYSEIAQWSPAAVERIDKELGTSGRISRENWIEQAQILSRGGDTRFSREFDRHASAPAGPPPRPIKLPDAIREHEAARVTQAPAPLRALRSVRSKAYQDTTEPGPEAARRAASMLKVARTGRPDNLRRIKGIGIHIEKRLNALGVSTYEDIANWRRADIDRISQSLEFKGRIERENWVEQARILAAGGETDFSRRFDSSEGGTSGEGSGD